MLDAKILVDDQEANVLLLESMLEQEGFTNVHTLTTRARCALGARHSSPI